MTKHVFGMTKKAFMNRVFNEVVGTGSMAAALNSAEVWFDGHATDEHPEKEAKERAASTCEAYNSGFRDGGARHVGEVRAAVIELARKYHYPQGDVALIPVGELRGVFEAVDKVLASGYQSISDSLAKAGREATASMESDRT